MHLHPPRRQFASGWYGALKNKIYDLIELVFMPFTDVYLLNRIIPATSL